VTFFVLITVYKAASRYSYWMALTICILGQTLLT